MVVTHIRIAPTSIHLTSLRVRKQGWVLDGTVDKTWFKQDKTGQNLREAMNHSNGCETIEG